MDVLAIPITTVASKSAFSTGGQILTSHRSQLYHITIEALMCTRSWIWNSNVKMNMMKKVHYILVIKIFNFNYYIISNFSLFYMFRWIECK